MINASILNRRAMHYVALAALLAASLLPALLPERVDAAQLTSRSVQISSSLAGDTGVQYDVNFTLPSSTSVGGVVVDFCDNNPIIGDSCTETDVAGMNIQSTATVSDDFTGTFTKDGTNSTSSTLVYTNSTPQSESSGHTITLTNVTNPAAGTFYARILIYTSEAAAQGYTATAPGSYAHDGGAALDTADQVTVTAKVHETLSFTVDTKNGTDSSIALGNDEGVLVNTNTVYKSSGVGDAGTTDDNARLQLATNAQNGAVINMTGDTLTDGGNNIDAHGATAGTLSGEDFGLRVVPGSNITATAPYDGAADNYALDTTSSTTTFGDQVASVAGPTDTDTAEVEFAAQTSNTTPAGVYTGTYTFIATGTF